MWMLLKGMNKGEQCAKCGLPYHYPNHIILAIITLTHPRQISSGPARYMRLVLGTSILRECPCHRSCMTVLCLYIVLFCVIFLWSYYVI